MAPNLREGNAYEQVLEPIGHRGYCRFDVQITLRGFYYPRSYKPKRAPYRLPGQRIPGRPTDGGDRFTPRGLLPRLFSRLMIALIVIWIVLMILHMWS